MTGNSLNDLARLRASTGKISWRVVPEAMHLRFSGAFKRYALDLETTPIKDAVARLKSRSEAVVRRSGRQPRSMADHPTRS